MKTNHVNIIFIFVTILTACGNKSSNNQLNSNSEEERVDVTEEEWVEVTEEVEEKCTNCLGAGIINSDCSECGGDGYKTHYLSGTQPKSCSRCHGTGVIRCQQCDGNGRCQYCDGRGSFQCTVCHGYGLIVLDINNTDSWFKCNNCNGTGYEKCSICGATGKSNCCDRGMATCPTCWGTGQHGQESYSYTQKEECPYCNGSGRVKNRCFNCNGEGTVIVERVVKKKKSELE